MLKNYFTIAFRNLWKNKGYSFINILGLTIGMASAILILLWIQNEVSYDNGYPSGNRIYTMFNRDKFNGELWAWNSTPKIMAPTIQHDYPEVEKISRYENITFLVTVGDKKLNGRGAFADSSFLSIFGFPLLKGNATQALAGNYNIVLTQKMAVKLFGKDDPLGKTVRIDSNANFTVSAVLKDLPNNTSFEFEYLLPWAYMDKLGWNDAYWGNNEVKTYVLLKPGASVAAFNTKVKDITTSHSKETAKVFAYPFSRLHLYGKSENGQLVDGQVVTVGLFGMIALFILLIACINFMNLSTARSEKRAKEVGIRKVAGALRQSLIGRFIGESVLLSLLAFLLAILLVQLVLPFFNQLVGKQLFIDYSNPWYWLAALSFIGFTGLLAGSYPAFYLSSFTPVKVLKGTFKQSNALVTPRKILVVLQFTFAIVLIISTIIVQHQIQFAQTRDTGYDRQHLIYAFTQGDVDKNYKPIKQDLLKSGAVISLTKSANPITQRWSDGWGYMWEGSTETDKKVDFVRLGTDADFIKTIGITLLEGRDIDIYQYPADTAGVMINEAAAKILRLPHPIGQQLRREGEKPRTIVGVVKDFILESPFEKKISPMLILGPGENYFQIIHMKLNPARSASSNIATIEKIFKQYNPQYPFDYAFADESYARKFKEQQRTGTLAILFAGLTIFISCLGLFGLATYMAENRVKEIGVRKVLGASVLNITALLSKDFLQLVLISLLIASPLAWWAMSQWLQNYTYRINIEWWVFAGAGLLSILIALATVSYQSIRAAISNPVKSLRSE
ncbi:MAG TPA: ABC transporter permease [Chitinophagaceae bacterium]|nr:ABC transporter permease [Chitinophagaceae bacterium]